MMGQLHKKFTDSQVKEFIERCRHGFGAAGERGVDAGTVSLHSSRER